MPCDVYDDMAAEYIAIGEQQRLGSMDLNPIE